MKSAKPEHACCKSAERSTKRAGAQAAAFPTCRAKKHATIDSIMQHGCSCVKAPPIVPVSLDQTRRIIGEPLIERSGSSADHLVDAPATCRFEQLPSSLIHTGPPLLALYCIWLK